MKQDSAKIRRIFVVTTVCLLVVFFIVCVVQLVFITSYRQKQQNLESSLNKLEKQVDQYQQQLDEVTSEDYLDRYARDHGYIKDGEEKVE